MRLILMVLFFPFFGITTLHAQPPCPIPGQTSIVVQIRTDAYGYETGWEVRGASGTVYFNLPFGTYANNTLYQRQVCVPADDCITIRILDSYGDGIFAPGYFVVIANSDTLGSGRDITYSIDQKTGYILRTKTKGGGGMRGGGGGRNPDADVVNEFSDYRKTDDGFVFPYTVTTVGMGASINMEKIEVNRPIDPKLYKPEKL